MSLEHLDEDVQMRLHGSDVIAELRVGLAQPRVVVPQLLVGALLRFTQTADAKFLARTGLPLNVPLRESGYVMRAASLPNPLAACPLQR